MEYITDARQKKKAKNYFFLSSQNQSEILNLYETGINNLKLQNKKTKEFQIELSNLYYEYGNKLQAAKTIETIDPYLSMISDTVSMSIFPTQLP